MSHNNREIYEFGDGLTPPADILERLTVRVKPKRAVEPLDDTVVFRAEAAETTAAGIIIPEKGSGAEARKKGIVIAVGPGRLCEDGVTRAPMRVQVGDWLILRPEAPTPGRVDHVIGATGEEIYLCRDQDVMARVVGVSDA